MWNALIVAIRFLTIIPVPRRLTRGEISEHHIALSLLCYPLAGLLIGLCLFVVFLAGSILPNYLQATLAVTGWVMITGALHLDGLADSADAWMGGHGDRQKTLDILRDTSLGVAGVVALILILILKIVSLAELDELATSAVVIVPLAGRVIVPLLFVTTRYVRDHGLATPLVSHPPVKGIYIVLLLSIIGLIAIMQVYALVMLLAVAGVFLLLRFIMIKRIGGSTGDTAGAMVEITEAICLLALVIAERTL